MQDRLCDLLTSSPCSVLLLYHGILPLIIMNYDKIHLLLSYDFNIPAITKQYRYMLDISLADYCGPFLDPQTIVILFLTHRLL